MPIVVVDDELTLLQQLKLAADKLVVVDFTAKWCGPCRKLAPILDDLSKANPNSVFIKVDVDQCSDLASSYEVSALPTIIFIKKHEVLDRIMGADKPAIESRLQIWATPSNKAAAAGPPPTSKKSTPAAVSPSIVSSNTSSRPVRPLSKTGVPQVTTQAPPPSSPPYGNNNQNVSAIPTPPSLPPPPEVPGPAQPDDIPFNPSSGLVGDAENPSPLPQVDENKSPDPAKNTPPPPAPPAPPASEIVEAFYAALKPNLLQSMASSTFSYAGSNQSQAGTPSITPEPSTEKSKTTNHPRTIASNTGTGSIVRRSLRNQRVSRMNNTSNKDKLKLVLRPPGKKSIVTNSKIVKRPKSVRAPGSKVGILKKSTNVAINPMEQRLATEDTGTIILPKTAETLPKMKPSQPVLKPLQIRLADGSKLTIDVDMAQPISSLRELIIKRTPDMANKSFTFMKLFPSRDIKNENMSIRDAKLINGIILQKYDAEAP